MFIFFRFVIKNGRHSQFLFLGVQLLKTFSFETTSLTKKRKNLTKGIYMEGHLKDFLIFFFFSSNFNVVLCNIIILIGYMGQATTVSCNCFYQVKHCVHANWLLIYWGTLVQLSLINMLLSYHVWLGASLRFRLFSRSSDSLLFRIKQICQNCFP